MVNIHIDPVIASRIKSAWANLSPAQQTRIAPMLARASQHAQIVAQTGQPPQIPTDAPRQALLITTALHDDKDQVMADLQRGVVVTVGPTGEIYGTGKYEEMDPGWVEAGAVWMEYYAKMKAKAVFVTTPQTIEIPDQVQIAIAGDWGTGNWRSASNPSPSADVARWMDTLKANLTIHLGDTYYSGTEDEEKHLLVIPWPVGTIGALTLNSNHEMYNGANGYFSVALNDPKFRLQKGCSFFALQNTEWVIVALDSAYYADEDHMYLDGSVAEPGGASVQIDFLRSQIATGKKVILLSHHGGLSLDGGTKTALWSQVMGAFPPGAPPVCWYWGHEHAAVVYSPGATGRTLCRCCGHGGIPWGHATALDANSNVAWFESRSANDPDIPKRVLNGFAMLNLDGPNLKETFYDENGGVAWSLG